MQQWIIIIIALAVIFGLMMLGLKFGKYKERSSGCCDCESHKEEDSSCCNEHKH